MRHGNAAFEHRLELIERRGQLAEEQPGVNGVAPLEALLAGRLPVAWIVPFVLQALDAFLEERVVVVVVEGDARAEDVDQREALVLDGLPDQLCRCLGSPLKPRATKVAPAMIAEVIGLTGISTLPNGVLLVFMPSRLVGEICPVVSP